MVRPATRLFVFALFATGPALADSADEITLRLSPQEVVAIQRSLDRQPLSLRPPTGHWPIQVKIIEALRANPAARRAVDAEWK